VREGALQEAHPTLCVATLCELSAKRRAARSGEHENTQAHRKGSRGGICCAPDSVSCLYRFAAYSPHPLSPLLTQPHYIWAHSKERELARPLWERMLARGTQHMQNEAVTVAVARPWHLDGRAANTGGIRADCRRPQGNCCLQCQPPSPRGKTWENDRRTRSRNCDHYCERRDTPCWMLRIETSSCFLVSACVTCQTERTPV